MKKLFNVLLMALFTVSLAVTEKNVFATAPDFFADFSKKDTDLMPLLDRYFKLPELAFDVGSYIKLSNELFGRLPLPYSQVFSQELLPCRYPDAVISRDELFKTLIEFKKTYAIKPKKHIKKLSVNSHSKIVFIGDLHGNVQAFSRLLCKLLKDGFIDRNFNILDREKNYIVFLGDFVDYGLTGVDTLALAMKLRIQNPANVFLCRGNHEEEICRDQRNLMFNFGLELQARYGKPGLIDGTLDLALLHAYEFMPVGLFIGIRDNQEAGFIQCCHGGLGYDIEKEIQALCAQEDAVCYLEKNSRGEEKGHALRWGDFSGLPQEGGMSIDHGRGARFGIEGEHGVKAYGARLNIRYVFRGHQDRHHAVKHLLLGVDEPECLIPHAQASKDCLRTEPFALWLSSAALETVEDFNKKVFLLEELPHFIAPVFTFSNASSAKSSYDEGFGILTVGPAWEKSTLQNYIFRPDIFKMRACVFDPGVDFHTYFSSEVSRANQWQIAAMVMLLPHYTFVDSQGNPHVYLEQPRNLTRIIDFFRCNESTGAEELSHSRSILEIICELKKINFDAYRDFYNRFKKAEDIVIPGIDAALNISLSPRVETSVSAGAGCALGAPLAPQDPSGRSSAHVGNRLASMPPVVAADGDSLALSSPSDSDDEEWFSCGEDGSNSDDDVAVVGPVAA